MKSFNEKHQTLISWFLDPIEENTTKGEITPHRKRVFELYFFTERIDLNGNKFYLKIELPKHMIVDLYNQIQEIESQFVDAIVEDLPF
jgi:hypothetical protein